MTGNFCSANSTLLLFFAFSLLANAQQSRKLPQTDLRVEVETNKRLYSVGETVRFTAILRNSGRTEVYISKSFFQAGGGIAGFYVSVKQLKGTLSGEACGGNGDRGMESDSRTPDQVLREDYLALPPGAMVGFETQYGGCDVKNPGTYQITATYSAQDLNVSKVRQVGGKTDQIVTGQLHSAPVTFRVH